MRGQERDIVKGNLSRFLPIWLLIIIFIELALINIYAFALVFGILCIGMMFYLLAKVIESSAYDDCMD